MKTLLPSYLQKFLVQIFVVILVSLGLWLVYTLRSFISLFLVACFLALLLWPFVAKLRKWKIPDVLGILATFMWVFVIVSLFFISIIPLFVSLAENTKSYLIRVVNIVEVQADNDFPVLNHLPFNLDNYIRKQIDTAKITSLISDENRVQIFVNSILENIDSVRDFAQKGLTQVSNIGISFASSVATIGTNVTLVVLLTFFILLERRAFLRWFFGILPSDLGDYFRSRQKTISHAIHAWLRGQLTLAAFMFSINLVGLFVAQLLGLPVHNIFSLALIAGAMEFVPYLGPVLAFLPAFIMVLVSPEVSMWAIVGVIALYIIFQQLEGNIMVPLVMSKTTNLSSLYILVVTLIGASLWWALGVLLAIPLASVLYIFYYDWMQYRRSFEK